jgi:hypothetical protein
MIYLGGCGMEKGWWGCVDQRREMETTFMLILVTAEYYSSSKQRKCESRVSALALSDAEYIPY